MAERFENGNGQRINFFACGTPWHPHAQFWLSIFPFLFEQRRQETFF